MGEKKAEVPVGKELVRMTGIMKEFPGVKALDNVKLDLYAGEVLALLGENGAGKSTLMKILSGVYQRDDGEIILFGNKIGEWDANKAKNAGVSIIHQELNMCTHLSVAENIFLGRELIKNGRLDNERMNQETKEILHKLNIDIDPREQVSELAVSKQQMVKISCPADSIKAGLVLAPEDRKKDGLCTRLSIADNIALPNLDILCEGPVGTVNRKKEKAMVDNAVKALKIKLPNAQVDAGSLSGGNQQKVVVAKWLARNSRVVIFDEPTRGIDVAAKVEIYNLMNQLKQNGIGVMFVSSEMPEVMGMSDRIIVMCDGRITGELSAEEATQDMILTKATQFEQKTAL